MFIFSTVKSSQNYYLIFLYQLIARFFIDIKL